MLPGLELVHRFFKMRKPDRLEPGRYEIRDKKVFAIVVAARGKTKKEARLETHRKYVDVHLLLKGEEQIGWLADPRGAKILRRYSSEDDMEELADRPETWLVLDPGSFAVFMPGEPHAPLVSSGRLRKIVLKIKWRPLKIASRIKKLAPAGQSCYGRAKSGVRSYK